MIFNAFILIANGILQGMVSILPVGALPDAITTGFDYIISILTIFNFLFPIDTLLTIVVLMAIINIILYQYGLAMIILRFVVGRNRTPH